MIRTVSSSLLTFKTLTFTSGLNILLADVAESSTDRHTRNSAGKTSLFEIIHFLLGSDATKASLFKHEALCKHSFSVELLLGGRWVCATRSGAQDDVVNLQATDAEALGLRSPLSLFAVDENGKVPVPLNTWKAILGAHWFKLPQERTGTEFAGKGAPSFRTLAGYFARRRKVGGFDTIEKSSRDQQPGSWQVAISYLLGLEWQIAREFQDMRDRKRAIAALSKAVKDGELGQIFGTTAEIRPELTRLEERISVTRAQVNAYQVHDSYRELADLARLIHEGNFASAIGRA